MVEVLIDVTALALIGMAILSAFGAAFKSIAASKAKIAAVSLANEKMEIVRNMPYDNIGTTDNTYPPGQIPSLEEVGRNSLNFDVHTTVKYIDDPSDGTIDTNPPDIYPYDYKKIEVFVTKRSSDIKLASLTTNIAAKAAETSTNTGILYLCVVDSMSMPVGDATVVISNDDLSPPLLLTYQTEDNGCVMVPLLPPDSHNNYHLVITKDGFSSAQTYSRTAQNPNEEHQDIDILVQEVTRVNMSIDKVSNLTITALDLIGNPVANPQSLGINLSDDFEIYFNPTTYRYSEDLYFDSSGQIVLNDLAYGNYSAKIIGAGSYVSSTNPNNPIFIEPDTDNNWIFYITDSSTAPRIESISPASGGSSGVISIIASGDNFDNNATMKLVNGLAEIIGSDIEVQSHREVSGIFDLSQGSVGSWDLIVTNPDTNEFARKVAGFEISE